MDRTLDPKDLMVNTYIAKRTMAGCTIGIHITHKPTGLTASCSSERGEWYNRKIAMGMLEALVAEPVQLDLPIEAKLAPSILTDSDIMNIATKHRLLIALPSVAWEPALIKFARDIIKTTRS